MIDPEKLKTFLDTLVKHPGYKQLEDGTTFCNEAVESVSHQFGVTELDNILASEIIALFEKTPARWLNVSGKQAADYARRGGFGVSGMKIYLLNPEGKLTTERAKHDHVATVYPAEMKTSGSLGREVPMVANIGKKNGIMKSSEAYPVIQGECSYWILA
jgi:hypothetical protein